ncbi:MAG: GNAT family N-acetyltransferase [Candidatus Heimdallarchaeota archaeon]
MIRNLSYNELDFALKLTEFENWGTSKEELEDLYLFSPKGFFVSDSNGNLEGIISTACYNTFGFIGNLIVLNQFRNQGVGSNLIKHAIDYLLSLGIKNIMLDAVPEMCLLYKRFNFKSFCRSLRLEGEVDPNSSSHIRLMTKKDLTSVISLDKKHFKGNRSFLLQRRFSLHPELCYVLSRKDELKGYIMGIPKKDHIFIGPWVVDPKELKPYLLLQNLISNIDNRKIRIGILDKNQLALRIVSEFNLNEYFYSIRMILGKGFTQTKGLIAIAGPDRG